MDSMRILAATLAILALVPRPALATGGFSCSVADRNLKLNAEGAFSHGAGAGVVNFGGSLEVLAKAAPEDLRKLDLAQEHLTQRWLSAKDLRLLVYRERSGSGPHGSVELILQTIRRGGEEAPYRGSYVLNIYFLSADGSSEGRTITLRGPAECVVG